MKKFIGKTYIKKVDPWYREKNNDRVPILVVLTDKMPPDNSTLDFPLRMPIYIPNFGRRGLSKNLIM